ncbi:MAG: cupin domain-containing protein [Actinomycetes bacterium]
MNKISLDAVVREQREKAATSSSGRSAETIYGGHEKALRQTVIAMNAGVELTEHESPGNATVQVLAGRVELRAATAAWEGRRGDLIVVPDERHALHALEDSAVLLTVVKT